MVYFIFSAPEGS